MAASSRGILSATATQAKKGKGEHPPCRGMHKESREDEAEENDEEELAVLPPARKRAQQQQ